MAVRFPCSAEDETHSAVSPNTSANDGVALYPNLLHHNCYVFVPDFITSVYCFSMKANQYMLIYALLLFLYFFDLGVCAQSYKYLAFSKYLSFQLLYNSCISTYIAVFFPLFMFFSLPNYSFLTRQTSSFHSLDET
jgi:hypothetical protein